MQWVKSLHVIFVIAWMAGLLYLPRLMVYHADSEVGSKQSETFKVMERRLLRGIATPAMIGSWAFGLWLAWWIGAWGEGWFHAKLACVVALTGYHGAMARFVRAFAEDRNTRPARLFRLVNEVPTLFLIAIVILVIVKPF
jgi:putative membrane protein